MATLENPLIRLSKDLKLAAVTLSDAEARFLVDSYYQLQGIRIAQGNQISSMNRQEVKEPHAVLDWFCQNAEGLEGQIKRALDSYSNSKAVGLWAKSQYGIGPVIAAGLLAHIDMMPWTCMKHKIDKTITACSFKEPHPPSEAGCGKKPLLYAGQIWSYAGIGDPSVRWEKGEKRPWNATLKTLCWKIGQSFLKVSTNEKAFYGLLLRAHWEELKIRNERLEFSAAAREKLERFKIGKSTDAYKAYSIGKLPPAHILQRACRYSTKIFLSHYHCVAYESHFGEKAALPYIISIGGHKDYIPPPNWPMV